jgi:uncharacterized protein YbaP (TraB family)
MNEQGRARASAVALKRGLLAFVMLAPLALNSFEPARASETSCTGRDMFEDAARHPDALRRAEAGRRDQLENGRGLLWRIDKPNVAPSYLFGTIHSTDDRAVALARQAAVYAGKARVVATELAGLTDDNSRAELAGQMFARALSPEDDTLASAVTPAEHAEIDRFLATRGLQAEMAHHMRPWFLAAMTGIPACEAERQERKMPEVDAIIARAGEEPGAKTIGLETAEEQTDALAAIAPSLAARILLSSARRPDMDADVYATMLGRYAVKQPAEVLPVVDAVGSLSDDERKAQDEFSALLVDKRNAVMADRVAPLLADGNAFIAVGALHLVGKNGLVERIRRQGYQVTAVW